MFKGEGSLQLYSYIAIILLLSLESTLDLYRVFLPQYIGLTASQERYEFLRCINNLCFPKLILKNTEKTSAVIGGKTFRHRAQKFTSEIRKIGVSEYLKKDTYNRNR